MVLAFVAFEARRSVGAAVSITIGAAVKLFPLAALSVAVFHPRRLRFAIIFIAVLAAAIALPLVAIPPGDLLAQYRSWHAIEAKDALRRGYSLMHYVHAWFGVDWPNWPLQAAGTTLLLLPVALRPDRWASLEFRRLFLCSLLVYAVLFNHASESPSFVVAYAGIVIWYVSSRSEEHTSELQSQSNLVCRLLLEKKKKDADRQVGHQRHRTRPIHCAIQLRNPGGT